MKKSLGAAAVSNQTEAF